jgi:hypothetical protein
MNEYTLSTGKVVKTREISAYQDYMMSKFLTGTVSSESARRGEISASVAFQMAKLKTLFSVSEVNGQEVKMPYDEKSLIRAFSKFSPDEFEELQREMNPSSDTDDEEGEDDREREEVEEGK